MPPSSAGNCLDPVARRFTDPDLERGHQLEACLQLRAPSTDAAVAPS